MKKVEELGVSQTPWKSENKYRGYSDPPFWEVIDSSEEPVFDVSDVCGAFTAKTNATLMSAAPELYDVCQRILSWENTVNTTSEPPEKWEDIISDIRKAVVKAGGVE